MTDSLLEYSKKWHAVYVALQDDSLTMDDLRAKYPFIDDMPMPKKAQADNQPATNDDPLNASVLAMLAKETGLASRDAWWNIWWLISKSEHDNEKKSAAFQSDEKGVSVFEWAGALSYDWKERGVTMGLVGFTTAYDGKDAQGDAMKLFETYTKLGGKDLSAFARGCTTSKGKCKRLVNIVRGLGDDPRWIQAQWNALFADGETGYLRQTVNTWRQIGVSNPSALAIATVLDASLNQGCGGPDGGCVFLKKLAVKGDEDQTLKAYNAWRRKVAGTNEYNDPAVNGQNRADMFEKLRQAKCFSLENCDSLIKKIVSWEMK